MSLSDIRKEAWSKQPLSIIVFGASGDLAKKKTYPSLFALYLNDLLPKDNTIILGYARSDLSIDAFHQQLIPFLQKANPKVSDRKIKAFLTLCIYFKTEGYDSAQGFSGANKHLIQLHGAPTTLNTVCYLALPPAAFIPATAAIKAEFGPTSSTGFLRIIIEKPFGHDTKSAKEMSGALAKIYPEQNVYRIDHYLGKEMVQSLTYMRFANRWLEPIWNANHIRAVVISFKEDIGTQGRGGYFDKSGIIRDIMQNHLMQVLAIIAMEQPNKLAGPEASDMIRDEKVKVLKCIRPWKTKNTVLGQYTGDGQNPGYLDDPTVPRGSNCPTFACVRFKVDTARWEGVPFIMKAGKALNQRRCEVRLQMKPPPGGRRAWNDTEAGDDGKLPLNEIVLRIQPNEAVYIKTNIKTPGFGTGDGESKGMAKGMTQSEVDLTYKQRYPKVPVPDAYTRLVLDVLRGKQENFVRKDELIQGWKIVTPLLKDIEKGEVDVVPYRFGTRGPRAADKLIEKENGYVLHKQYNWGSAEK